MLLYGDPPYLDWEKTYGGGYRDYGEEVIPLQNGGYIVAGNYNAGAYTQEVYSVGWILKTNSQGDIVWDKKYGDQETWFNNIKIDGSGYIAAGTTYYYLEEHHDCILTKIDSSGNVFWEVTYGSEDDHEYEHDIEVLSDGYLLLCHSFEGGDLTNPKLVKFDRSGNLVWEKLIDRDIDDSTEDPNLLDLDITSDGKFICTGYIQQKDNSNYDFWLIKFDNSGEIIWDKSYDIGSKIDWAYSVVECSDGGFAVSGEYYYEDGGTPCTGACIIKTDSNGNKIWSEKHLGYNNHASPYFIDSLDDGSFIIAGDTGERNRPQTDFWVLKIDNNGKEIWDLKFGEDRYYEKGYFITQTWDDGYIAVGYRESDQASEAYNDDLWLLKLSAEDDTYKPNKPSGPSSGETGTEYTYSTTVIHPDGYNVKFAWDWDGDGSVDYTTENYYESGETCESSNIWSNNGLYTIKVKAIDEYGQESQWSEPLSVTMPKEKNIVFNLWNTIKKLYSKPFFIIDTLL